MSFRVTLFLTIITLTFFSCQTEVKETNAICPEQNYKHRYINVPLSYKNPELGSFNLYYELDSMYDPSKPTVMFASDAQTTESWVGKSDFFKNFFESSFNFVTYQYRGFFCSRIDQFNNDQPIDWNFAFEVFNSNNAVEDIEQIRKDLNISRDKFFLAGGSGMAVLSLKYLSIYHKNVSKAFLLSFFKDAGACSNAPLEYFDNFLIKHSLKQKFVRILNDEIVPSDQLYFITQRLLYDDQEKVIALINQLEKNDLKLYHEVNDEIGSIDDFIKDGQKWPQFTVFMFETNLPPEEGRLDINYPYYAIASPLQQLAKEKTIPYMYWDVKGLDKITTEVMIVAGAFDQVTPISTTEDIRKLLPNSKIAIFKGYHCLNGDKEIRNPLMECFLNYGFNSSQMSDLLNNEPHKTSLVKMY